MPLEIATAVRGSEGRALAIAASAAVHAGLFLLLAWRLGETPPVAESPVMVVELTPWPARQPPNAAPAQPQSAARRRDEREVVARPSLPPLPGAAPPAPFATGEAQAGPAGHALRGLLDCRPSNLHRLPAKARERCERKLAGDPALRTASAGPRLNLDPSGRYVREEEPYLARRPKKGCKVRTAGDVDAMGEHGAAGGVACVIPF